MLEVKENTDDKVKLTTGTLYGALKRLLAAKLIEEIDPPADVPQNERQSRYYRLTSFGQRVVTAEAKRLERLASLARRKGLLEAPSWNPTLGGG